MSAFRLKRQLWRRWRRWKKALWVGTACALMTLCAWSGLRMSGTLSELLTGPMTTAEETFDEMSERVTAEAGQQSAAVFQQVPYAGQADEGLADAETLRKEIAASGQSRKVYYKTTYVCGDEVDEVKGPLSPEQLEAALDEHPDYKGRLDADGAVWLERSVNDLSPTCKKEAYIGMDDEGNLTLFKGPPKRDKALKTFFQIDIGTMKSSLPEKVWKQLQGGIRVQDIDEYNSVLSTFSDFARDEAERAM